MDLYRDNSMCRPRARSCVLAREITRNRDGDVKKGKIENAVARARSSGRRAIFSRFLVSENPPFWYLRAKTCTSRSNSAGIRAYAHVHTAHRCRRVYLHRVRVVPRRESRPISTRNPYDRRFYSRRFSSAGLAVHVRPRRQGRQETFREEIFTRIKPLQLQLSSRRSTRRWNPLSSRELPKGRSSEDPELKAENETGRSTTG